MATGLAVLVVRYLLVFVVCACIWRVLYIVRPCLGDMPGWPHPPACSGDTLLHRATVPGPPPDLHYFAIAIVALLIVILRSVATAVQASRNRLPGPLAFALRLAFVLAVCLGAAVLLAPVQPCFLDILESPGFAIMCYAVRDILMDSPANPLHYEAAAIFAGVVIAAAWWRLK
jgi:hypothetical protein